MTKRDDIKNQIKKQQDEVYGEGTIAGSSPDPDSDDNILEALQDVVGSDINPGDEFHLADEVMKDEKSRLPGQPNASEETEEDEDADVDEIETPDTEDIDLEIKTSNPMDEDD